MKKFLLCVVIFGAAFTSTYTYLDVTNNQEKDVQTIEQTTTTRTSETSTTYNERPENNETGISTSIQQNVRNIANVGGRTFELTNPNATMIIQEDGWHMDTQQGNYHVLVNYTDENGTEPLCTLQINGDGWTLYNQNNVIIDGGSLV